MAMRSPAGAGVDWRQAASPLPFLRLEYLMADYRTLAIQVIASDGKVDSAELKVLKKAIYADGKVTHEEVNFLGDLRAALLKKAKKTSAKFDAFYLKALAESFLGNGVISADEVGMIGKLVLADKSIKNGAKKKFLDGLKKSATMLAPDFDKLYDGLKKK